MYARKYWENNISQECLESKSDGNCVINTSAPLTLRRDKSEAYVLYSFHEFLCRIKLQLPIVVASFVMHLLLVAFSSCIKSVLLYQYLLNLLNKLLAVDSLFQALCLGKSKKTQTVALSSTHSPFSVFHCARHCDHCLDYVCKHKISLPFFGFLANIQETRN